MQGDEDRRLEAVGQRRPVGQGAALVTVARETDGVAAGLERPGQATRDGQRELLLGQPVGRLRPGVVAAVTRVDDDRTRPGAPDNRQRAPVPASASGAPVQAPWSPAAGLEGVPREQADPRGSLISTPAPCW